MTFFSLLCGLLLLTATPAMAALEDVHQDEFDQRAAKAAMVVPINSAEAFFDIFFDVHNSPLPYWRIDPCEECAAEVKQALFSAQAKWQRVNADGPTFTMRRAYYVDCSRYDRLIMFGVWQDVRLRIVVETDKGERVFDGVPEEKEFSIPLEGASRIYSISVEGYPQKDGPGAGRFTWFGLQHTERLDDYLAQWEPYDSDWPQHLQDEEFKPQFEPLFGVVMNAEQVKAAREQYAAYVAEHGETPLEDVKEGLTPPEEDIRAYLGGSTIFSRPRNDDSILRGPGTQAAIAGIILQDKDLLRFAARCAMSLAVVPEWKGDAMTDFPTSGMEHRAFKPSRAALAMVVMYDLAGEYMKRPARELIEKRLAEHALGIINYVVWRYDYVHKCNQLPAFSEGRMMAYSLLENSYPHIHAYNDLAYEELQNSLKHIILPDGGFVEGPSYFCYSVHTAGHALHAFAQQRGKTLNESWPQVLKETVHYANAMSSTVPEIDMIPIGDADFHQNLPPLALMAAAMPDSHWTTIFRKAYARSEEFPIDAVMLSLLPRIPEEGPPAATFVHLPEMGLLSSLRYHDEKPVKLVVPGNQAGAGHAHEDKGSFVLEYAGQMFAMDPGRVRYDSPLIHQLKSCQRHNMLVPYGLTERPAPSMRIHVDVKPTGEGDDTSFRAEIDATPGWEPYYEKWVRSWDSPTPNVIEIRDEWALKQGEGVEWLWQTPLDVEVEGREVVVQGENARARITAPENAEIRVDRLEMNEDRMQNRLAFRIPETEGALTVRVVLE